MQAFLESFATVDEVYQECKKRGIKGVPTRCTGCVIAELLKSEYPERFETGMRVEIYPHIRGGVVQFIQGGCSEIPLPQVMNQLALAFDEGMYPDLVKEPA